MSKYPSRQAKTIPKGNHRRTLDFGKDPMWGYWEYQ